MNQRSSFRPARATIKQVTLSDCDEQLSVGPYDAVAQNSSQIMDTPPQRDHFLTAVNNNQQDVDGYNELIIESMGDVGGSNTKPNPNGQLVEDDDDSPQLRRNFP